MQCSQVTDRRRVTLLFGALCGLFWAQRTAALEWANIQVGQTSFRVEIVRTSVERARGLMGRAHLPAGQGMLFVQPIGPAVFWMKNTLIPLDMLYFDDEGRLVQTIAEVPPCTTSECPTYPSDSAAIRYVLELNAGEARRYGIRVGDRISLGE